MTPFVINIMLAVAWAALFSSFSILTLTIGFVVGYLVVWLMRPVFGQTRYSSQLLDVLGLVLYFHWELLISSVRVAWLVLKPGQASNPGVVTIPLEASTDLEITVLSNLVSLTPGTLTLDVSDDRSSILVHGMFVDDAQSLRDEIKRGMEKRTLGAMR